MAASRIANGDSVCSRWLIEVSTPFWFPTFFMCSHSFDDALFIYLFFTYRVILSYWLVSAHCWSICAPATGFPDHCPRIPPITEFAIILVFSTALVSFLFSSSSNALCSNQSIRKSLFSELTFSSTLCSHFYFSNRCFSSWNHSLNRPLHQSIAASPDSCPATTLPGYFDHELLSGSNIFTPAKTLSARF